ncbi:GAP family protein [Streptantibioticus ferralitis]|uniref:GAP family protein n=1 Tax=Streptantibioticus ferralitis TaxID=236510 RepID=A0ABT5YZR7_9ACTN|nr:GAP family protein [Streptantibioticus ferralitis]MDF2256801.1 GAP family protein [Streptantibioticus ferralitis]
MGDLTVLPLAVTMMMGPQIITAVILVTTPRPVRASLAFVAGVIVAAAAGTAAARGLAALLSHAIGLGAHADRGSAGNVIQYILVALLLFLALRSYRGRATAEPPKWLGTLLTAGPGKAFKAGLLLVLLMPSDIVIMLTVGANLASRRADFGSAIPFLAATALIAALPLLIYLLFRPLAAKAMPKVRDSLTSHSWLVNVVCCLVFVVLILSGV